MKNKLAADFAWWNIPTKKEHKKERAREGMIVSVRKNIEIIRWKD